MSNVLASLKSQPPNGASEIQRRWDRLSAREIAALEDTGDLVGLVQSKYQLARTQAQEEVDAFAKGRQL
jgi:hypothetical protein